jgi:hypothetical protein
LVRVRLRLRLRVRLRLRLRISPELGLRCTTPLLPMPPSPPSHPTHPTHNPSPPHTHAQSVSQCQLLTRSMPAPSQLLACGAHGPHHTRSSVSVPSRMHPRSQFTLTSSHPRSTPPLHFPTVAAVRSTLTLTLTLTPTLTLTLRCATTPTEKNLFIVRYTGSGGRPSLGVHKDQAPLTVQTPSPLHS